MRRQHTLIAQCRIVLTAGVTLLLARDGAFKPEKCFSHLIFFSGRPNGKWKYDNNEENEDFDLSVQMPDGVYVLIDGVTVDEAK